MLISLSLAALIVTDGMIVGMTKLMVASITHTLAGEAQVHRRGFLDNFDADLIIDNPDTIIEKIRSNPDVRDYAARIIIGGMIASSNNMTGAIVYGVDPEREVSVSRIKEALIEGEYLTSTITRPGAGQDRQILIGKPMAELLEVTLGDRIVVTVTKIGTGEISQELFRLSGIFEFGPTEMDEGLVFINLTTARRIVGTENGLHEIAVRFNNPETARNRDHTLYRELTNDNIEALGWLDFNPEIAQMVEMSNYVTFVVGVVLFFLASLGVINSLFMSIYERIYEFGVAKAIGTSPFSIAQLVLLEALFIAVISCLVGNVIGYLANSWFAANGLPLGPMEFSGIVMDRMRTEVVLGTIHPATDLPGAADPGRGALSINVRRTNCAGGSVTTVTLVGTVIQTRNLCRFFGNEETRVTALDHVSIEIERGEFTAVIGPSGLGGKTTLLHLIGGLDNPSSGEVLLSGTNIADMTGAALSDFRRDHIGFVFQAYNLIPVLSAEENIEYIMLLQGIGAAERRQRVLEMLTLVGLDGLGNRRPAHLSGGQQQRVAVARAMASNPDIILADEPTANLDSAAGIALLDIMKGLNAVHNMTFVFSTHDQKIMDRARRLVYLQDGKIERDDLR